MRLPLSRLPTSWLRSIRPGGSNSAKAVAIFAIAVGVASGFADARDNPACDQFDWSIKRELQLFADPDLEMVFSGASLSSIPEKGLVVELQPHGTLDYVLAPAHEPKSDDAFDGLLFVTNVPQTGRLPGDAVRGCLDRSHPGRQGDRPFGRDDQSQLQRCPQKHAFPA